MDVSFRKALKKAKPSPAMVIAFVALLAALGGTATALDGKNNVDNNDIKKNAVDSANISKNQVKADDVLESSLAEVPLAANGVHGYALIVAAGTVSTATASLNVTNANVTRPSTGVYCFNGLTFTPKTVVVTGDAEAGAAADNYFSAALSTDNAACAGAEQASVESRDDDQATNGGVLQNAAFYVVFG